MAIVLVAGRLGHDFMELHRSGMIFAVELFSNRTCPYRRQTSGQDHARNRRALLMGNIWTGYPSLH